MHVALADDESQVRSALRLLLEERAAATSVAEATNETELMAAVLAERPDLVLLDWELPPRGGGALVRRLRAVQPALIIVALSSHPEAGPDALAAGADAFVSKADPPEHLLSALARQCQR